MKGHYIPYSVDELTWLEANRLMIISDYARAFNEKFGRDVSAKNLHALRKRKGWRTGRTGCFVKGEVPHNKGKPCEPGKGGRHPNARRTQFKKGVLNGTAKENVKPIGFERIAKDGYIERKVNNDLPFKNRWRAVQHIRWEEANGPVPNGHILKCLDGNRQNTHPSNWTAIPRGTLPFLNGHRGFNYDAAEPELKPAILTLAKVKHARARVNKKEPASP